MDIVYKLSLDSEPFKHDKVSDFLCYHFKRWRINNIYKLSL